MDPTRPISRSTSYEDFQNCLRSLENVEAQHISDRDSAATHSLGHTAQTALSSRPQSAFEPQSVDPHSHRDLAVMPENTQPNTSYLAGVAQQTSQAAPATSAATTTEKTAAHLRSNLAALGFYGYSLTSSQKASERIAELSTTADTLIKMIYIANDPEHPFMQSKDAGIDDRNKVISGIMRLFSTRGMDDALKTTIISGNNDPKQILHNLIEHYR